MAGRTEEDTAPSGLDAGVGSPLHNQSVLKAVALIGCFVGATEGQTLTELARRTNMSMSTAYRMLQTLTSTGVLRRLASEDRYAVGPLLLSLAGSVYSNNGYALVLEHLKALAVETGETVSFGIRDEACVAVLISVPSSHPFGVRVQSGERIPIHLSAMGKILLARSVDDPEHAARSVLPLLKATPKTITRVNDLARSLAKAKSDGFAISDEERYLGVRSIAIPIEQSDTYAAMALEVHGPSARMTNPRMSEIVAQMRVAAESISHLPVIERLAR
ncbi:IclR family transcriptional regulator [Marinivivus vitaminiproducens]|uniref:IclR family transcriptional regulator n=1 Tax=Marinivivus vitaminiproducens TaxID=3035935 RepID=UPI0027A809AD|nr:IclR family transcriptional regulator [Geminicoccaceae bacterium SCSIO 64248]